jgi:hypothetical protein
MPLSPDSLEETAVGYLVLSRPEEYANALRQYDILAQGELVARIENGDTLPGIPFEPGEYEIVAKIDWCRSKPLSITIKANEGTCVKVRCYLSPWKAFIPFLLFFYLCIPGWYVYLQKDTVGET